MRKTFTRFALLALVCSGSLFAQPVPELLYYKFDGTGTTVPNLALNPPSGTATATIVGGLTQGSTGQCGGALIGNGGFSNADYVNTGWVTNHSGSWTISFWTNNVPSTTTTYYIFGDVNAGGFRCFTGGVAGAGNWILRGPLTDVLANGGASTLPTMTTFVYDMATSEIRSYVNGSLDQIIPQPTITLSGSGPFKVGAYSASSNLPAGSLMDEFRFYDRALTVTEIQSLLYVHTTATINPLECGSTYTAPSGAIYSTAGTYMDTIPNVLNCDSVITINLSFGSPSASTINPTVCDMYVAPSGTMYMASGTYMDTIPNMTGCDSVITINLTVNPTTTSSVTVSSCVSYTAPSGAIYSSTGIYYDTIPNMNGCDSLITIDLTINGNSASSMNVTACDLFTGPSGATYMSSGTFIDTIPNMAGCDSLITIDLTLISSSTASISPSVCYSYTSPSGNHTWSSSGTYMDTLINSAGCDSLITINLTVNQATYDTTVAAGCGSFTTPSGMVYTSSGIYLDTIANVSGCDSVITIVLTINNVNTVVTQNNGMLMAAASGAIYQWLDCNNNFAPIPGATGQTYTTLAGSYAVSVTENNCTDTSACFLIDGIGENAFAQQLKLFPNPTTGGFAIDLGGTYDDVTVSIADVTGRVIVSEKMNQAALLTLGLDAPSGVYVVTVTAGNERAVVRLVKE